MAINFDYASKAGPLTSSTATLSHTTSGSDRLLFAFIVIKSSLNVITSVKYNDVSMTLLSSNRIGSTPAYMAVYYLVNPTVGTNNIVATFSSSYKYQIHGISYNGCKQTDQPNTSSTNNTSQIITSITGTVTTTIDNCWTILFGGTEIDGGWNLTAGNNSTLRSAADYSSAVFDSNGPKSPAGSTSMTANAGGSGQIAAITVAITPLPAVGPANIKSYNTNLIANIKSINTNLISNVKTLNTNQ